MNNILIDTNVLMYALDETSKFHEQSASILLNQKVNLFITTKNVSEFFAVCSKLKLDFKKYFGFYQELKENAVILAPSEHSLFIFEALIQKYKPKGNQVYDTEIVSIMLANNLKSIATANISDFKEFNEVKIFEIKEK
jgi:predicted nucleic acid-binding protein